MNILGISAFYHDSAACLVRDGEIIAAAQEERFSRIKHDFRFPTESIKYCLAEGQIGPDQLDFVAYYDKPWLKFERLLETYLAFAPRGLKSFLAAMPLWLKEKLWLEDRIREELADYSGPIVYPEHHQSHAASAFYPSPFKHSAIITIDGVGEWATASHGIGRGNKIELKAQMNFPHSLGLLYSAFTQYTGFRVNSGEYKMMGLAPYGEPKYKSLILDKMLDLRDDGSFRLNIEYFDFCHGLTMTSPLFDKLFGGPPRRIDSEIRQKDMDIARSIQDLTEEIILRMARYVRRVTDEKNLCMAGGVALNSVANGKIVDAKIFDNVWIQPASGDAGGALGAALFAGYQVADIRRAVSPAQNDSQKGSLVGPSWSTSQIAIWLDQNNIRYHRSDDAEIVEKTATALAENNVVGWFSGRMEFGPRALGCRSILANPTDPDMQARLNLKIKFRESFRPFAPAVLTDDASNLFEIRRSSPSPSPYMQRTMQVNQKHRLEIKDHDQKLTGLDRLKIKRTEFPAVTHVDFSARIQTVDGVTNRKFYNLLNGFKRKTGLGMLVNTSFNIRGEPIVCNPGDALNCFFNSGLDILVLENCMIYKEEQNISSDRIFEFLDFGEHEAVAENIEKEKKPIKKLRRFGFSLTISNSIIGTTLWLLNKPAWPYPIGLALLLALISAFQPMWLARLESMLFKGTRFVSRMLTKLLLTLAYFFLITPIGQIVKLTKKGDIKLKPDESLLSYWIQTDKDGPGQRFFKQY